MRRAAVVTVVVLALAGCGSNETSTPTTTAPAASTTEPTPTGLPPDAVRVETSAGPIWIAGEMAYAAGCTASGLTEQAATAALAEAGHPAPAGFTSWGLFCQS